MANPDPSPATRFQKGVSANPGGRPKALLTADQVRALMSKFAHMTHAELKDCLKDPNTTALELLVVATMLKGITGGDQNRFSFLLDRTVGRVKDFFDLADGRVLKRTVYPDGTVETIYMADDPVEPTKE